MTFCSCGNPKPVTVTVDDFSPLFADVPESSETFDYCDRCGHRIRPSR